MNIARSCSMLLAGTSLVLLNGCNSNNNNPTITPVSITAQPLNSSYYTSSTDGPRFSVILMQNPSSNSTANINSLSLQGDSFKIINRTSREEDIHYGTYAQCTTNANPELNQVNTLSSGGQCVIVIEGAVGSPMNAPSTGSLSISANATGIINGTIKNTTQVFNLKNTTYLYAVGNFHNLGGASAGTKFLLAACNNGSCQNYLSNESGADETIGEGQITDSLGNLYIGGNFHNLGNASAGDNYLLAKCAQGMCENYFNNSSTEGADNSITQLVMDSNKYLYVGGMFQNLGAASTTANYLLAKCSQGSCQNYFGPQSTAGATKNGVNAGFSLVSIKNDSLYLSGSFNNLNGISTSDNYLLAKCTIDNNDTNTCQNYLTTQDNGVNGIVQDIETDAGNNLYPVGYASRIGSANGGQGSNPAVLPQCSLNGICENYFQASSSGANAPILSITKDANGNIYTGGGFTQLGNVSTTPNSDLLLAKCTQNSCQNYFSDGKGASNNTYPPYLGINHMITDIDGNLYVGGNFSTLDNVSTANGSNLLAVCSTKGEGKCKNFLNDANGADGGISTFSINNQISVTAQ